MRCAWQRAVELRYQSQGMVLIVQSEGWHGWRLMARLSPSAKVDPGEVYSQVCLGKGRA